MAGAGNRTRSLKSLDFVALCDKSRARGARWAFAKSWQAQGIRGFVDVSLERTFLGTQRQAASGVSRVRRCAVERSGQAVTMGVGSVARAACVAPCHGDCCWACRVGAAVPWGLLGSASSWWRRVLGIADQGAVCVAPCH